SSFPPAGILQYFMRGIVAGRTGDAAAGMGTGTAHIKSANWTAIIAVTQNRPGREHLVEIELAVHDIAAGQAEDPLQIERTERLHSQHGLFEPGRETVDRGD